MMGLSPQCYIPSFGEIGPPLKENKILDLFYHMGPGDQLGHVISSMSSDFHFLVPVSFHIKVGSDRHSRF